MMTKAKLGLHWFRHDLRVNGNEALAALSRDCSSVLGVYVYDPKWDSPNQWGMVSMGKQRKRFVEDALANLRTSLKAIGSELIVVKAEALDVLVTLLELTGSNHLSYELHAGFNERADIARLKQHFKSLTESKPVLIEADSNYLYSIDKLPFVLENMPDTFSPFRRKVEKYAEPTVASLTSIDFDTPLSEAFIEVLKQSGLQEFLYDANNNESKCSLSHEHVYAAGEAGALKRIDDYFFATDGIATYKETRNGLDGWNFSSRLSAYLAHGCVSPRTVLARLRQYESERVANDSTYWLFFELLWREFFHLQHIKHGTAFFAFGGIQSKPPSSEHNIESFKAWCSGNTGYDIVDACMRQLNTTGFMSNRGRQLVASCFVHELNLDWRYGAAYFEQQLIDFDVASNWGNWQYLAGVGADPRGHRQFNLAKQTEIYDPQGEFISNWTGNK